MAFISMIKVTLKILQQHMKFVLNPLIPGGNKRHTYLAFKTNLQLKAAGLFKYMTFCYHQAWTG